METTIQRHFCSSTFKRAQTQYQSEDWLQMNSGSDMCLYEMSASLNSAQKFVAQRAYWVEMIATYIEDVACAVGFSRSNKNWCQAPVGRLQQMQTSSWNGSTSLDKFARALMDCTMRWCQSLKPSFWETKFKTYLLCIHVKSLKYSQQSL